MAKTVESTAPEPDNSFVKTTKAEVVYDSVGKHQKNDSQESAQFVNDNKLPQIENASIDPVDKATIELELAAIGQDNSKDAT